MNPNLQEQTRKDAKNFLRVYAIVFLGIFLFVGWQVAGQAAIVEKPRFVRYLNKKYGQEFAVENVHLSGAGLGVQGSWRGEAYPKADPSLRFEIRRSQSSWTIGSDTFLQELWTKQGSHEVEDFLSSELPNNEGYVLEIKPGKELLDSIQGEYPDLGTALKNHKRQIAYSLSVRGVTTLEANEPSTTQLNNALKVVDFVKAKGTMPAASYAYYNYREPSFSKSDQTGQQLYQYGFHIEQHELSRVNSIADLQEFFTILWK